MEENKTTQGQWKCKTCNATENVTNGFCKKCGPTQTLPLDETAEKIAGVPEAEAEKKRIAEEKLKAEQEVDEKGENATEPV